MKLPWKWMAVGVAVLLVLGLGAAKLLGGKAGGKAAAGAGATARVEARDFAQSVLAIGTVKPKVGAQVNVGARTSGKVQKLNVKIGDTVKKDQVIAVIEHRDLEAELQANEAQVASAKVQIEKLKARRDADAARFEALLAQKKSEVSSQQARLDAIQLQGNAGLDLERRRLESVVAQLRAQLQTQEAAIQEQEAAFQLADKDRKRMASLFEKGMLAEQSLDKAKAEREAAQGRLNSTKRQYDSGKVKLSEEASVQEETVKHALTNLEQDLAVQQMALEQARAGLELAQKEAESALVSFDAEISVLEATLPKLEAQLDQAKTRLSYATVLAPIDGVVGTITTQEGETVAAGFSSPTFVTVVDLARLQVDAYVDEVDIGKVKPGQEANFTVDAFPDRDFKGRVVAIYPSAVLKDNVVYYDVVVDIVDEFAGLLRPEMTANVSIFSLKKPGAPGVPVGALVRKDGKNFVQVVTAGKAALREVTVGIEEEDFVELSAGVKAGEQVLLPAAKNGAGFPHPPGGGGLMGGGMMGGPR